MSKQVIEHAGVPVGIAIPDEGQLRFFAVKFSVFDLDQRHLLDIGNAGHINIASGFGRWTDGYDFLDRLKASIGREAFSAGNGTRLFSAAVANTGLTI
ncbi:serine hydrolase [Rhizobium subbaraonis]|uniref:Serine hydrolase n=1 Tax=Rhizobium subbaraonis TaxID=908946 RepID=A0A285UU33_9HYPH|nr:serine hydrolase [Rhizobium subbaraonis]